MSGETYYQRMIAALLSQYYPPLHRNRLAGTPFGPPMTLAQLLSQPHQDVRSALGDDANALTRPLPSEPPGDWGPIGGWADRVVRPQAKDFFNMPDPTQHSPFAASEPRLRVIDPERAIFDDDAADIVMKRRAK